MLKDIAAGRTHAVFDFIAQGGKATDRDERGTPAIVWCAHYGDVSAVRHLLAHGAPLSDLGENLALGEAVFHGHEELTTFLLGQGADANYADKETGETPLHLALCKANRPAYNAVVDALVSAGADPNRATRPSMPTACFMRDVRTKGETPLHRAAAFGSEHSIQRLLDAGARRDAKDMSGDSPLSWASWHLRPAPVLRLLCYGDFTIRPENRSTYDHGSGWTHAETR